MGNIEDQKTQTNWTTAEHVQRYLHNAARDSRLEVSEATFKRHLFFVTITFKPSSVTLFDNWTTCRKPAFDTLSPRLHVPRPKQHPLVETELIHNRFCKYILGNNFRRKPQSQLVTIGIVDAEGTKFSGRVYPTCYYLHVHALMLVRRSDQLDDFLLATELAKFESQMPRRHREYWLSLCVDGFKCEPFNPNKGRLIDGIDYWMKGYLNTPAFDCRLIGQARLRERPPREWSLLRFLPDRRLERSLSTKAV